MSKIKRAFWELIAEGEDEDVNAEDTRGSQD